MRGTGRARLSRARAYGRGALDPQSNRHALVHQEGFVADQFAAAFDLRRRRKAPRAARPVPNNIKEAGSGTSCIDHESKDQDEKLILKYASFAMSGRPK